MPLYGFYSPNLANFPLTIMTDSGKPIELKFTYESVNGGPVLLTLVTEFSNEQGALDYLANSYSLNNPNAKYMGEVIDGTYSVWECDVD